MLASNNMEECAALCTDVMLLADGEAKCLDTVQNFKDICMKLFDLKIKAKQSTTDLTESKNYITGCLNGLKLKRDYYGMVTYTIDMHKNKWSSLFATMRNVISHFPVEDFSICQTSLDEHIMHFARK